MSGYKKITRAGVALILVGALLFAFGLVLRRTIPDTYIGAQRAYLTELERQLAEFDTIASGRRIALIGSSPVILGLSAKQIESATGIPTRNLAMNASRGVFKEYAAMVFEHLRPGDIAVIVNPNVTRLPLLEMPLSCVWQFGLKCIRDQGGRRPRFIEDAMVLFTDRAFGYETSPRSSRGDFIFPEDSPLQSIPRAFTGPFPKNTASDLAELAEVARRDGLCPIIALTPLLPQPEEHALWQSEFDELYQELGRAGLRDIVVQGAQLWSDPSLFHHHEHPSERGREIWSQSVIAKLQEGTLPEGCARAAG